MTYRVAPQAETDLGEIFNYIARDSRDRARRWIERFYREFASISEHPTLFRLHSHLRKDLRTCPVGPYIVFFRVRPSGVVIERVLHGARNLLVLLNTIDQ